MGLNWNEIKSRALLFSKTWADACNEDSQAKPFWIDFFEIFGITDKRVGTFELKVKQLGDKRGFMDLFWSGMLLVEHKSLGKNLDKAVGQALDYLHHLKEHELPQLVVVCDFDPEMLKMFRIAVNNGKYTQKGMNPEGVLESAASTKYPLKEPTSYDPDVITERDAFIEVARRLAA